jgi:hypothetical protein
MSLSRRSTRGERGQVTTALVIIVVVALVTLSVVGLMALARGVDEKSQAQSAADAAALAGAAVLSDELPDLLGLIDDKDDVFGLVGGCGLGQDEAATYASKNEAVLTGYCFDLAAGRVEADVRMSEPVSDDVGPARASAVASPGLDLSSCSWNDEEPEPTPTPTPSPTPTEPPDEPPPPPPPPPDIGTTLSCGPLTAEFVIGGESGLLTLVDVEVDLEPSLIE